ncbi:MAG: transcriptional regulator NrdR [Dehalococcoidia bacterium]|nr:transcriptional regulator NrdR [Dehalococcoidia bacterium]
MKCPYCNFEESRVLDSRDTENGVRRRRKCLRCAARFTTYERLHPISLFVIKKDERREEFHKEKLLAGIRKACEKRPLPTGAVENVADDVERELYALGKPEVSSSVIGDMVMAKLGKLDSVAYIRFASVYREFTDITDLKQEVESLIAHTPPPNGQLILPIKP